MARVFKPSGGKLRADPKQDIAHVSQTVLNTLENKLDQLINLCERLEKENKSLRSKESDWARERTRLIEKNELARTRVEAMIARLKNLEAQT